METIHSEVIFCLSGLAFHIKPVKNPNTLAELFQIYLPWNPLKLHNIKKR